LVIGGRKETNNDTVPTNTEKKLNLHTLQKHRH